MTPITTLAIIAAVTFLLCFLPALGAWVYFRGTTRSNPIPAIIKPAGKTKPPEPAPPLSPIYPCPHCTKQAGFTFSADKWTCKACKAHHPKV
jgi:hypothetical protein